MNIIASAIKRKYLKHRIPEYILITTPPTKLVYVDDESVDVSGMVVTAYNSDESVHGIVPNNELTIVPTTATAPSVEWETLTTNEQLVDAFKAYCKSRNVSIEGSVANAVASFTVTTLTNICSALEIDMASLLSEIQRAYDNGEYKYAFTATGLSSFNSIFAEFLQNNDLAVGDTVDEKILKSGRWFQDYFGNGCFVFETNQDITITSITKEGTYLKYYSDFTSLPYTVNLYNSSSDTSIGSLVFKLITNGGRTGIYATLPTDTGNTTRGYIYERIDRPYKDIYYGGLTVIYSSDGLYYGTMALSQNGWLNPPEYRGYTIIRITNNSSVETSVYITTNNQTINNETVISEGDTYIIDENGDPTSASGSGEQTITTQWPRPEDGEVLETSFEITVSE